MFIRPLAFRRHINTQMCVGQRAPIWLATGIFKCPSWHYDCPMIFLGLATAEDHHTPNVFCKDNIASMHAQHPCIVRNRPIVNSPAIVN